mmetsp:Transcript_6841/g.9575  ORF Transcript_6841/g.9575 Transcript_6841/m.9575 type:complete len:212 (+) Transcript_6841:96-731(+)
MDLSEITQAQNIETGCSAITPSFRVATFCLSESNIDFSSLSDSDKKDISIETETAIFFWKPPSIFSQWTPSPFTVDNITYSCAEQFMMAQKANLFGDDASFRQILSAQKPISMLKLGRQVKGFDPDIWNTNKSKIVYTGNLAKFSQNSHLKQMLLDTADKMLVEASPKDKIWGIGLRPGDPNVLDKDRWLGHNLLGQALMKVRDDLKDHQT